MAAIISTTLRYTGQGATSETDGKQSGRMTASREFDVVTTADATEVFVHLYAPVPRRGDPHPDYPFLRCRTRSFSRLSHIMYRAAIEYVLEDDGQGDEEESEKNPLLKPAKIRYGHATTEEPIDQEAVDGPQFIANDNKPIVTVAGESFDPPISRPFSDRMITIEKNFATFDVLFSDDYFETVNEDTFLGYPPGRLLCEYVDAEPVEEGDLTYYKVTASFKARKQGRATSPAKTWHRRIRAEGFLVKVAGSNPVRYEHYKNSGGDLVSKPVLHKISDGTIITDPKQAEWYEWKVFPTKPFQALGII